MADRRLGAWAVRLGVGAAILLTAYPPNRLTAQDSQFGIRGLGTPGKPESVRSRGTAGAFAPFDALSPLLDASLADVRRMTAGVTTATSWRNVSFGGIESSLRGSRIPTLVIAGPITRRITIGGGFSTYLDRSFGITTQDTLDLRGVPEPIMDEVKSDGAISDLRLAAAIRLRPWLGVGAGFHMLTGSTRVSAVRRFEDSTTYRNSVVRDEVSFEGLGGSISALADIKTDLRLALWLRTDDKLRAAIGGRTTAEDDLPLSYGAGLRWNAGSQASLAGTVAWRNWATAGASPNVHDTFNWSLGAELGTPAAPFRVGVRGGQLPFGVGSTPTELGVSLGIGKVFSGGRGRLDAGLERLDRKGGGLKERVWTFLLGLTVRP
jgi:hypothetical protein